MWGIEMKRKIVCMLIVIAIILTTVDVSVFASDATVSGNFIQEVEEQENESMENSVSENELEKNSEVEMENPAEGELEKEKEAVSGNAVENNKTIVTNDKEAELIDVNGIEYQGEERNISGKCGDNLTWNVNGEILKISGTGNMWDYNYTSNGKTEAPWGNYE